SQEPVILKPVQHHIVTQGEMSRLLQQQAETFQSQIRQLQESLKARDVKPVYRPKPKLRYYYNNDITEHNPYPDEGGPAPRHILEQRLAGKIAKRITKARERREDAELNRAMRELSLDDHDDPMDTSNAIRSVPIELVQENYESAPQEQLEVQEEYLGSMAMDIDVVRLENTKDLLAINGIVNEVDIQCLADSCANVSWIQEEAVLELKLKADKSIKHSITGASGPSETLGIIKNVS
ncbi:hypothetical protein RclHR1_38700001, partial [Rhizophagus clarus]